MGFGDLEQSAKVQDGKLVLDNTTSSPLVAINNFPISNADFTLSIVFANKHNSERKRYTFIDTDGNTHKIANPSWGVVWNYIDDNNYDALELRCNNTSLNDIYDTRYLTANVVRISNGEKQILSTTRFDDSSQIHVGEEFNAITLLKRGEHLSIIINGGIRKMIASFKDYEIQSGKAGILAGAGARVEMKRLYVKYEPLLQKELTTNYTLDILEEYFKTATDKNEGYWEYLDRDLGNNNIRLGGKYKLAIIKSDEGYDILFVDGANHNSKEWKFGMIKGQMTSTPFIDVYKLTWYDSMFHPFSDFHEDATARFQADVLTINLPINNSSIRFYKISK